MSWINENKFAAGLAGVTAIISGGILFFGMSQAGVYEEKLIEYNNSKDDLIQTSESKPYPNEKGLAVREEGLAKYESLIKGVNAELQSYKPKELKDLTPEEFSDARVAMERGLRALFTENKVEIPSDCSFGFERYSAVQASADATSKLSFQLAATNSLLVNLANAKPNTLLNIKRYELPVENGNKLEDTRKRGNKKPMKEVYQRLPMELAFTASEASVRNFLKDMVSSKDYFYSINSLRIKNEKQTAPTDKGIDFPVSADTTTGGDFADFVEDEAEVPKAHSAISMEPGARVLKQLLGSELLHVHLSFDILLVKGSDESE